MNEQDEYLVKTIRKNAAMRWLLYLVLALLVVSVFLNVGMFRHFSGERVTSDTVRTSDTVYVEKKDSVPSLKDEKVTGQVVILLPNSHATQPDTVPSGQLPSERDSIVLQTVQRRYSDDSTYTAYVSGVNVEPFPRLDSITVRQRTITNTLTATNTIREKRRHWHFGVGATAGYGVFGRQYDVILGAGVLYEF